MLISDYKKLIMLSNLCGEILKGVIKMNGRGKSKIITGIIATLAIFVLAIIAYVNNNISKNQTVQSIADPEILRSLNYEQVSEEEEKGENEYVKFLAFFTRDLDGDGYAEKLKGTCKNINSTDELFIELNVLTDGYFKNGQIRLDAGNFTWETAIISDSIVAGNYMGKTKSINLCNNIPAGSQKIMWGTVKSDIGNNIYNYSKETTITLTGIHVSADGKTETPITKTAKVVVDWYGDIGAKIKGKAINKKMEEIKLEDNGISFQVDIDTNETREELLLKETSTFAEIPQLNGYNPIKVVTTGNYTYDEDSRVLTIKRESIVDDNGNITTALSKNNVYTVEIQYPYEAYNELDENIRLEIPVSTYYEGYNNSNKEFSNPKKSNIASALIVLNYSKYVVTPGEKYNEFDVSVVEKSGNGYYVLKTKPLEIYNNEVKETEEDYYWVDWSFRTNNTDNITSILMKETTEKYTDKFLNKENQYSSMLEYIQNVGIYFSNPDNALGENGYINVYNDETNELIHKFTKDDWNLYSRTQMYKYVTPVKHIRIETSNIQKDQVFTAHNLKEIDDELLVEKISKEDFDKLEYIYSYLYGSVQVDNQEYKNQNDVGYARYTGIESLARISTTDLNTLNTQETRKNFCIYINPTVGDRSSARWKNGQFIVKLPKEIIAVNINNITISNPEVKILGYELYEEGENYLIKIITENDNPINDYDITINCDVTPDPSVKTSTKDIILYAYNEEGDGYRYPIEDQYDIDDNKNTEENVGWHSTKINFAAPNSMITSQYISDYNEKGSVKIAPNVVDIEETQKDANINLFVLNNYTVNADKLKIVGVIPSKENIYPINRSKLGSEFDVKMKSTGIVIPESLKNIVTVYYSEKLDVTNELNNSDNAWTKEPEDWSKVKTYLIDFGDYIISAGASYTFTYGIEFPENAEYNTISYSEHAINFELHTAGGKLAISTEPNKLGMKLVRYYDFDLLKLKKGTNRAVPGATYQISGYGVNKLLKTGENGICSTGKLYVGMDYEVKEIKSPDKYYLNDEVLNFKVFEGEDGNLQLENPIDNKITFNSESDKVEIRTEDEPKYSVILTKKNLTTGENLQNVVFSMNNKLYYTDENGKIVIENLEPNNEYTIQEIENKGYYELEDINFKFLKNPDGSFSIESNNSNFENCRIENTDDSDYINVYVDLENEKIPTYNLKILKVEDTNDTNVDNYKKLEGAKFQFEAEELGETHSLATDENGEINIEDMYVYVEGKDISGKYTLQELEAPSGYCSNIEEITFNVSKNEDGNLKVDIENKENLTSVKDVKIDGNNVTIIIKDVPLFKLIKTDKDTGIPLANVGFAIYEINSDGITIGFAKDTQGNYVGEKNDKDEYIVTTDENGSIVLPLKKGKYKAVEVVFPENYEDEYTAEFFEIGGKEDEFNQDDNIVEINYIEDLIDVRLNTSNYRGKTLKLMRSLSFHSSSSYRNSSSTQYGDYNDNGTVQGIMSEVTSGQGWMPINNFQGVFDGNGYSISGLNSDGSSLNTSTTVYAIRNAGLFGTVNSGTTIKNLTVNGSVKGYGAGIIAAYATNTNFENCYVSGSVTSLSRGGYSSAGGIVGNIQGGCIDNCRTEYLSLNAQAVGSIVGIVSGETTIKNCYNTNSIQSMNTYSSYGLGGIVGVAEGTCNIINCYNTGNLMGLATNGNPSGEYTMNGPVGGIVGKGATNIVNCYNTGNLSGGSVGGIIGEGSPTITDCYNAGDISCSSKSGGIVGDWNSSAVASDKIVNCYNIGNVENGSCGPIIGYTYMSSDNVPNLIKNTYYADSVTLSGTTVNRYGTAINLSEMESEMFYDTLNVNNVWTYRKNSCPKLYTMVPIISEKTNININNTIKKYNITTEIGYNEESRSGGTITGSNYDGYIKIVEKVKIGNDSVIPIEIKPDEGYSIFKITINGEEIQFVPDENGNVELPIFENVLEDKHIVVTFVKSNHLLIIQKQNENGEPLAGANFDILAINPAPCVGEISKNQGKYTFSKNGDVYVPNNVGVNSSTAYAYFPIDLSNYQGTFKVVVSAKISSESGYDYGYATVNGSPNDVEYNNSNGRFMYISGSNSIYNNYTSQQLEGGMIYYLHIGYRKDVSGANGSDRLFINNITIEPIGEYSVTPGFDSGIKYNATSDKNGICRVPVDETCTYKIVETKAPKGYALSAEEVEVELKSTDKDKTVTIINKPTNFKLVKKDSITGELLAGAEFKLVSESMEEYNLVTDTNGYAEIQVPSGEYKLVETKAPTGYVLNSEEKTINISEEPINLVIENDKDLQVKITTKVEKLPTQKEDGGTISGKDEQPYENVGYNKTSQKDIIITPDSGYKIISITVNGKELDFTTDNEGKVILDKFVNMNEDKEVVVRFVPIAEPNFILTKKDEYTEEPMKGVQFAIYYLSTGGDFAKDLDGVYIGEKNEDGVYVVTTDENGEVPLALPTGYYKAIELKSQDGYVLPDSEEERTRYFKIVPNADIEIDSIDDLVKFANRVTSGNTFEGKTIVLTKDLDFDDVNSYEGNDGEKTIQELKEEWGMLANGFNTIGGVSTDNIFKGIFEGNGYKIKNFYSNTSYGSLFGYVEDAEIRNLTLTNVYSTNVSCGAAIVRGLKNSKLTNCHVEGGIVQGKSSTGGTVPTGGLVYDSTNSEIRYCSNTALVDGVCTGGITSTLTNSILDNCYNTGEIRAMGPTGGLAYTVNNSTISNCYNTGNVSGTGCSGGIAQAITNSTIKNCYNTGNVTDQNAPVGGLAYSLTNCTVDNFYNTGKITSKGSNAGGITQSTSNCNISNCYNSGNVEGSYGAGGLITYTSGGTLTKCGNTGNVYSANSNAGGITTSLYNVTAKELYNTGNVESKASSSGISYYVAGIAGTITDSSLEKCYNTGNTMQTQSNGYAGGISCNISGSQLVDCYNEGNAICAQPTGGIGYIISNCTLNRCYNTGDITSTNSLAGGIGSMINGSTVKNCYNTGTVKSGDTPVGGIAESISGTTLENCYNTGKVSGKYGVTGIVYYVSSNSVINNCYNAGTLIDENNTDNIAGIAYSLSSSDLLNTYYLATKSTKGMNGEPEGGNPGVVMPKSDSEMKSSSFVNELNNNKSDIVSANDWVYNKNMYPTLDYEIENITIENNIDSYTKPEIPEEEYKDIDYELIVTNSKEAKVIVHHYLEGTGPEYKNEAVELAEDETIIGKENYEYTTAPKIDIDGYRLIKNEDGEFVIPENASGKFTEEEQHVYYYYNKKPLELTVHHYLEGTEDELKEDEQGYYEENEHYKTNVSEDLLEAYELVKVVGDEEKDITQNEEVTYYYKRKQLKITTRVEIPEEELNEGRTEKGGTILGEDQETYETVKYGENSVNDIIAEPGNGYKLESITVNGEVVPFEIRDGKIYIDKFENMTENKEVVVRYVPYEGKVITHHYLEGTTQKLHEDIINIDSVGSTVTTSSVEINGYKLVGSEGNKDEAGNVVIQKEIADGVEEVIYYYQEAFIITTDVIVHNESSKDGSVKENVKGGNITNEDIVVHEQVVKDRANEKIIEIKPDEGYEISEIRINGSVITDFEEDENGNVTIPEGYFNNVQQNIHVEVKLRKKSKVIVKYMEEGTEIDLSDNTEILGYEGKEYETTGKVISGYVRVQKPVSEGSTELKDKVTDENKEDTTPDGTMFSDVVTVIYWYEKVDTGVIERHIETNEKGEEIELDAILHEAEVGENVTTQRKDYSKYVATDAPNATKQLVEKEYQNISLVEKTNNKVTVSASEDSVKEVWYYYIKQYNITTEVKKHNETIDGTQVEKEGGSISKEYETDKDGKKVEVTYEIVNSRGDNSKEIKMIPDNGYRIKSVTINGEELFIDNIIAEDGSLTLPVAYFEDIQQDYHVVVEYERIPAKVIVKYLDVYTRESIIEDKLVEGFVNDTYSELSVDIDNYGVVEPLPDNYEGSMTEEAITVIYYYDIQFKITTDVIEHLEEKERNTIDVKIDSTDTEDGNDEEKEKVLVKGGSIQGEDEEPYEAVTRGYDNTKEILIKPDYGYKIKSVKVIDGEKEYILSIEDFLTEDKTIVLPVAYFKDMQADKHIEVEFEKLPATVTVNYLDKNSGEKAAKQEQGEGLVGDKYITHEKEIPYYELIKDELPENAEGILVEGDTIVNYWYRKFLFNMKIEKEFTSIQVNGKEKLKGDNKFAKIDISKKDINNTTIQVRYNIKVTNTEEIAGIAKIVEEIPNGFKFTNQDEDMWNLVDGKYELMTKELKPGETVEYQIVLDWDTETKCLGNLNNVARITETDNIPQFSETTLDDNEDSCELILSIKTGEDITIILIISAVIVITAGAYISGWTLKKFISK